MRQILPIILCSRIYPSQIRGLMYEAALKADEDPDRLSFVHAVRVIRRKLHNFAAIPPREEGCVP